MKQIEALFVQLTVTTRQMLYKLKEDLKANTFAINFDDFFKGRELLLNQLKEHLDGIKDKSQFLPLYEAWHNVEDELYSLIEATANDLKRQLANARGARKVSTQYQSYLRQAPYGAFLDKKQ